MSEADEQHIEQPVAKTSYVSLSEAAAIFQAAGVYRSERTLSRYCENGSLACFKEQLPSGAMGYFIDRESIQDRIIELKQLAMSGHVATGRDQTGHDETGPDMSRFDETEKAALKERAERAEKERDEIRDENLQLKIDVGVRKELINEAKKMTDSMMEQRDQLMRYVGALEGQVRQLGERPVGEAALLASHSEPLFAQEGHPGAFNQENSEAR